MDQRDAPSPETPKGDLAGLSGTALRLRRDAQSANQRLTLVLSGAAAWTLEAAGAALSGLENPNAIWISKRPIPTPDLRLNGGALLLGRETDVLVFDALSGFDPDSFGAAVGSIRGGGLLLLLTPPLDAWAELADPEAARVAVHPFSEHQVSGRFLARFARVLESSRGVILIRQGRPVPPSGARPGPPPVIVALKKDRRTPDQQRAVEAILSMARGRARRPLVLISDRGRGKTSAFGLAAAALLAEGGKTILVTAPRRAAVEPLFLHASSTLPDAEVGSNRILLGDSRLEFLAPDDLCLSRKTTDLLLVDEAAGIPAPLLERLLRHYGRIAFATTVHGYEGTGRGFEVRFRRHLEQITPGWRELRLETPLRYTRDDPLEAVAARGLLLDADPAPAAEVAGARPDTCRFERLDREMLARDDRLLSEVFGLLVLAHYQTRPMDLRHLLDGPNLDIFVLRWADRVVATALVAMEGGLDPSLAQEIFAGRRRPRGHLLPQTLCAHAGLSEAPGLSFARIVRIAVHPAVQGRGLGGRLTSGILNDSGTADADVVGASFGATSDLLAFWRCCGFLPVHMGTARNAASGTHAVVVLRSQTTPGARLMAEAGQRFSERLIVLLAGPLRDIEPGIAARLLAGVPPADHEPSSTERAEIESFAFGLRPYEAALPPLTRLLAARLGKVENEKRLEDQERDALIAKILQHRDWSVVAEMTGVTGRGAAVALLRRAAGKLLA